ncbi:MAG: hypothetical protein HYX39_07295 [Bacteroidetes bacterium]|nr:hypothetical protein [Bacteroidota bacterium]
MKAEVKYFNFPIQLLDGFLNNPQKVLGDISDYALYAHCLKLQDGTETQRIIASAKFFAIKLGNFNNTLNNGRTLYESIEERSPKVGINLSIFWDYYKNEKTEFDKVCLLAFLAIKSIVQNKTYCKVVNSYWLCRMAGYTHSCKDLMLLPPEIFKYSNEYQTKKIKKALQLSWGLKEYSHYTRGFYVSFKLTLDDLVFQVEKKKQATKEKELKQLKNEAITKARVKLNTTRP